MAALVLAMNTQASLIVGSIELAMVSSKFNSTTDIRGSMSPEKAAGLALLRGFIGPWTDSANRLCATSLDSFEDISASATCGGPNRDIASLFAISGSASSDTQVQLGLDWGRGGFTLLNVPNKELDITRYNSDVWWHRNWDHGDVIDVFIPKTPDFLLVGLGFEGCCDGDMSGRWRSLSQGDASSNGAGQWQALAVTVPEPGAVYLLGLGLLGLVFSRRSALRA